jgi:pimeloyl-ACP methyl ester carboxylesterase
MSGPGEGADFQLFESATGRLAYTEYGAPGGMPALFIHGCLGSRLSAAPFHEGALEQSVRLIALDKPGFGRSDPQPDLTLPEWAELIGAFVVHLGVDSVSIVASSGGAPYGLSCARHIPEVVRSLLMINPIVDPAAPVAGGVNGANRAPAHFIIRRCPELILGCLRLAKALFSSNPGAFIRIIHRREMPYLSREPHIRQNREKTIQEAVRQGCGGLLRELQTYANPWGIELAEIARPVIIVQGDRDINEHVAKYYEGALPHGRLILFPGEDHLSLGYNRASRILSYLAEPLSLDPIPPSSQSAPAEV